MINRTRLTSPANPGASAPVVLYDDVNTSSTEATNRGRYKADIRVDQTFTLNTYWASDVATPLRLAATTTYTAGQSGHVGAVHAAQPMTCVAVASIAAGGGTNDYFTVVYTATVDGVVVTTTKVFEYKKDTDFVATEGRITIDVTAGTTATSVAVLTAAAIAAQFTGIATVPVPTTATLTITLVQSGARFSITATENVAAAGHTIGSAVTGVEGSIVTYTLRLRTGRNRVVLVTSSTAPSEFDVSHEIIDSVISDA